MKRSCCLHNCGCCKLLLTINSSEPRASNGNDEENGKTEKKKRSAFVFTAALTDVRQISLVRQISESGVTSLKQQGGETNTDRHLLLDSCSQIHQPLGPKRRPFGAQNRAPSG